MKRWIAALLIAGLCFTGAARCYGSFALTRTLHSAVGSIENRWLRSIVFFLIACWPLPIVYGVAILADAIILNTVEFWSGANPMAHRYDARGEFRLSVREKDARVDFIYRGYGESLEIRLVGGAGAASLPAGEDSALAARTGESREHSMILLRDMPGIVYIRKAGRLVPVEVQSLDAGEVTALQAMQAGQPVTTRLVPSEDLEERRARAMQVLAQSAALAP
ncbi:MAG: DUF3332 domain-containing protein [bacterium]|nr:DUF3332 domain-containing protein [bacterium]